MISIILIFAASILIACACVIVASTEIKDCENEHDNCV